MEASTVVIEVHYGDTVRHFNVQVVDLTLGGLTEKIFSLLDFAPDTQITLTSTDKAGEPLVLSDNDDLCAVVQQSLNPLVLTVEVNAKKIGTFTSSISARVKQLFQNPNGGDSEILKATLKRLNNFSRNSVSKVSLTAPRISPCFMIPSGRKSSSKSNEVPPELNLQAPENSHLPCSHQPAVVGACDPLKGNSLDGMVRHVHLQSTPDVLLPPYVRCDGSRLDPVINFKRDVDCELCDDCLDMGKFHLVYPRHQFNGFPCHDTRGLCATYPGPGVQPGTSKLDSYFILEPNAPHNIVIETSTPFTKVWRLKNNGTIAWPHKTQLVWIGGVRLSELLSVELQIPATGLAVGQELDVAMDFISPEVTGSYGTYWRMVSPSGQKFGKHLWALTTVIDPSPQIYRDRKFLSGAIKLDGCIIRDPYAPAPEYVVISPSTPFTKIWRVKNNGTVAWPQKTRLVRVEGKKLRNLLSLEVEIPAAGLVVGQELDVAVDFISPHLTGRFVTFWKFKSPLGEIFGQLLVLLLRVISSEESVLDGRASSSVLHVPSFDSDHDEDSEDDDFCCTYFS